MSLSIPYVHDGGVEIRDASHLWGKGNYKVARGLWKECPKASIALIGPARERLSRIANVVYDTERASGRGGLGAVLGSKKVKAVVVELGEKPKVANPEEFQRLWRESHDNFAIDPKYEHARNYGTTDALRSAASLGILGGASSPSEEKINTSFPRLFLQFLSTIPGREQ